MREGLRRFRSALDSSGMPETQRYRFAEYEFDATTGELAGPAGHRRLEPQPARVLALLLQRAGELVTREDLRREVWPDTHVDFDQGLNYCIRQIRNALGEAADSPGFLETLPRRGYRFIAPVEVAEAAEVTEAAGAGGAAEVIHPAEPAGSAEPLAPSSRSPRAQDAAPAQNATTRRRLALASLVVMALAVASWWLVERRPAPTADPPAIRLAVLPFHASDQPTSPWEERFGEALVVALTERGAARVAVVGPATTAPLAREGLPQGELGRRLGVDLIVSGGIRRDGESLFVQLLRAPGGEHLWATVVPLGDADAAGRQTADAILAAVAETYLPGTPSQPRVK